MIRQFLCHFFGLHDWRYASAYRKPGFESRAKCQYCEARKWSTKGQECNSLSTVNGKVDHGDSEA